MSSNLDDLLYGHLPQGAEAMNSVLRQFLVGEEHGTLRFCGKEFRQDEDFGIHVTAKDNTERVQPITYDMKHGLTRKATADEIHQLRSATQSLAWIARQTRPDLSYRISKIQSTFEKARVRDCAIVKAWNPPNRSLRFTDSPIQHTRCMIHTLRKLYFTEERSTV